MKVPRIIVGGMTNTLSVILVVSSGDTFPIVEALEGVGARIVFVREALTAIEWLSLNSGPRAILVEPTCDVFSGAFIAHLRRHIRFGRVPLLLTADVDVSDMAERIGVAWALTSDAERLCDFVEHASTLHS